MLKVLSANANLKEMALYHFYKLPISVELVVINFTDIDYIIDTLHLELNVKGIKVGNCVKTDDIKVKPKGDKLITCNIIIDVEQVGIEVQTLMELFTTKKRDANIRVTGWYHSQIGKVIINEKL
jgi:hypothetical protein